jgi:DNA-binding transcriptional ArsR family regulator
MTPRARPRARLQDNAPVFAALGDPTRLELVARLCERGPLSIARLADGVTVSRQAVAKHLRALQEAGLVHGSRAGRESVWALRPARLVQVRRALERISRDWDAALGRLRLMVEDEEEP